jgi:hypothetical protein
LLCVVYGVIHRFRGLTGFGDRAGKAMEEPQKLPLSVEMAVRGEREGSWRATGLHESRAVRQRQPFSVPLINGGGLGSVYGEVKHGLYVIDREKYIQLCIQKLQQ